jgi:hypothetical protein
VLIGREFLAQGDTCPGAISLSACAEKALHETHSLNCVLSRALEVMSWYSAVPAIESASAIVQKCRPAS